MRNNQKFTENLKKGIFANLLYTLLKNKPGLWQQWKEICAKRRSVKYANFQYTLMKLSLTVLLRDNDEAILLLVYVQFYKFQRKGKGTVGDSRDIWWYKWKNLLDDDHENLCHTCLFFFEMYTHRKKTLRTNSVTNSSKKIKLTQLRN